MESILKKQKRTIKLVNIKSNQTRENNEIRLENTKSTINQRFILFKTETSITKYVFSNE